MANQVSASATSSSDTPATAPAAYRPTLKAVRAKIASYAKREQTPPAQYVQWAAELEAEAAAREQDKKSKNAKKRADKNFKAKKKARQSGNGLRKQDDRGAVGVGMGLSFWAEADKRERAKRIERKRAAQQYVANVERELDEQDRANGS